MTQQERRKHTRYDQSGLALKVSRRGIAGMLKINPRSQCLDYSLSGLQFGSNQVFNIGEKLVLDLNVRDFGLNEVCAEVIECVEQEPGVHCTRVRFCFTERHMQVPAVMHGLLQIEAKLRLALEYPA